MSCPEVMYQAYYPYLYQRPSTSGSNASNPHRGTHFSPFTSHYDRFNVQRSLDQPSTSFGANPYHHHHIGEHVGANHSHSSHHSSAGSVSSSGGGGGMESPGSPVLSIRYKEEDNSSRETVERSHDVDDEEEEVSSPDGSRAQYVSANCVVFTHYTGDVAAVVDEHFTRALNFVTDTKSNLARTKESSPMSSRNFPASFWNKDYQHSSNSHPALASSSPDFYTTGDPSTSSSTAAAYHAAMVASASSSSSSDPWHSHYQQYAAHHHRAVHDYHHHNMAAAAQYGGLLLPSAARIPAHMPSHHHQYHHPKSSLESWPAAAASHHRIHDQTSFQNHTTLNATASYSGMPGLESQMQESSKDLYWF